MVAVTTESPTSGCVPTASSSYDARLEALDCMGKRLELKEKIWGVAYFLTETGVTGECFWRLCSCEIETIPFLF